ncbi:LysR substrate-binding domain-containing protein [Caballeronia sp. dw_276]|uniref:LysR substrate-binding domain-containing protein n=1 Tax=Caballeronia sp. dw_276 TaxID=2719795 RepID=UPI001BD2051B|nr:LysR substrate-binding domain-containing protein [Caballeronia sp. dw_276]
MESMHSSHAFGGAGFHRHLPPLHSLEVFASAARCGTFSRAAAELFVTQSAISRQVQQLEEHLGVVLFIRHKRGLRLTPDGEALLPVVENALARLATVCESLRNAGQILTLRMPPTFATRWFLPLLPSLRLDMPEVDVRVTTYDAWEPRFEDSDIDAAIIQGRGDWKDMEAVHLMSEQLTPVCSPNLAKGLTGPADVKQLPLLHCFPVQGWARWLEAAGLGSGVPHRGQTFDTLELALSAATRGHGVAMGDLKMVRESLQDGVLVAPFDFVLERGVSYYLIYPAQRAQWPKIKALREWLLGKIDV